MRFVNEAMSSNLIAGRIWIIPLATVLMFLLANASSARHMYALLLGVALGITLLHTTFGFAGAYRQLLLCRETLGVRAQLVMLMIATPLFAALLSMGEVFGQPLAGALAPAGVSVAVGAFLFGIGMQLGDGCASGTLYSIGGGSYRMWITLLAFCGGSFLASLDMPWWQMLPTTQTLSLSEIWGFPMAAGAQLLLLLLLLFGLHRWRSRFPEGDEAKRRSRVLLIGALLLALLNTATLVLLGHPWSITWGFTLWGAKLAQQFGWDSADYPFWNGHFQQSALEESIFDDITSLMNIGIVIGAFLIAKFSGSSASAWRIPFRSVIAAIIGGALMGYGARIAYGCNIGAFFSGVASLSLHGWLWLGCALLGSSLGVRIRPHFGLLNSTCNTLAKGGKHA